MPRETTMQIRLSVMEKIEIEQNAANAGKRPGPFLRDLGLGRETSTTPRAAPASSDPMEARAKEAIRQAAQAGGEVEVKAGSSVPDMSEIARASISKASAAFESRVEQLVASGTARPRAERQAKREGL